MLNFWWTFEEVGDGAVGLDLLNWLHLLWWLSDDHFRWFLNHIRSIGGISRRWFCNKSYGISCFLIGFLNIEIWRGVSQSSILAALRTLFLQISKFIRHKVFCSLRPLERGNKQRFVVFKLSDFVLALSRILIKSICTFEIVHRSVVTPHFCISAEVALCSILTILHSFKWILIVL